MAHKDVWGWRTGLGWRTGVGAGARDLVVCRECGEVRNEKLQLMQKKILLHDICNLCGLLNRNRTGALPAFYNSARVTCCSTLLPKHPLAQPFPGAGLD